jgi:cytochrome c peroxidase
MKVNKYFTNLLAFSLVFTFISCQKDQPAVADTIDAELLSLIESHSPSNSVNYFVLPTSSNHNNIPQDSKNPITPEKVSLGGFLFHETSLANNPKNAALKNTYSCSSCHHSTAGFQSGTFQGIGEGGIGFGIFGESRHPNMNVTNHDVQGIKPPSIINTAFQQNLNWNGQFGSKGKNINTQHLWTTGTEAEYNRYNYEGVETQALATIKTHRLAMDEEIVNMTAYKNLFDLAFPDTEESDRYTDNNAALAIAAYVRTLLSYKAPWQDYLSGNRNAMTPSQKEGAMLFFGKANCVSCHTGPALNSMDFYALGMGDLIDCDQNTLNTNIDNPENLGRASFTKLDSDKYKFKVPQLYNLRDSEFFGHGSTFKTIREVIEYKNKAIPQNQRIDESFIDESFVPLNLNNEEVLKLEEFIKYALFDAELERYKPDQLPSGQCFPNNDEVSRIDMGCK